MLESIRIRDFALIEEVYVDWTHGLNVLTGETGAGKSILIDALNTVLGGKVGGSLIRAGAEKASIEACFRPGSNVQAWLKQQELVDEQVDELIVSREITKSGSRIRVNGTVVNSSLIQELRQLVLTVHAQHEARTLMSAQAQLELLDGLGDSHHKKALENVRTHYARKKDLSVQLKELQMSEEERLRRLDFSRFQLGELLEAKLDSADEDEELTHRAKTLSNVTQLEAASTKAQEFLNGGQDEQACAVDLIQSALSELEKAARFDDKLNPITELLNGSLASMEEAAAELRRYGQSLDADPEALSEVEARLTVLSKIKRKYGSTLAEAISRRDALAEEVSRLDNAQAAVEELQSELAETEKQLASLADDLSRRRQKLAKQLCDSVSAELYDLGMSRCKFEMTFERLAESSATGVDRAEFMIAPNPGQPAMPLSKIASGGELSRIMLAIKTIFAAADRVETVIFDEIDTGLSGKTLQTMRDKLAQLARSHQILCITHQPIIASVADNHIWVDKRAEKNRTIVKVSVLDRDGRLKALASMASGNENQEASLNFARSLMAQADQVRAI